MQIQYQRGQIVNVTTQKMVPGGNALGRMEDGRPVFVRGGAPNEIAEVRLTKIKREFCEATFVRALESSIDRIEAPFKKEMLSGADWNYLAYPAQLKAKEDILSELLERFSGLSNPKVESIIGCDEVWRYRNKVELTFGVDDDGLVALGFHKPGRFDEIIPTNDVALFDERGKQVIEAIVNWANREKVSAYNPRRKTGCLRNLVMRRAINGDDFVINLVTTPGELPTDSLVSELASTSLSGIVWSENDSAATIVRVDSMHILSGSSEIREIFLGKELVYDIDSFFQTNVPMAEKMAIGVLDYLGEIRPDVLVDGYAGVGGFGLFAAASGFKVISIESHPASSADAVKNAERMQVANNMTFVNLEMEKYLAENKLPENSVLLVDPPRSGLHPKAIKAINQAQLDHVIYISCGPATLARDLKLLAEVYEPELIQPYDLFPQTSHMETLVILKRK